MRWLLLFALAGAAFGQWDGTFTAAQAERGKATYAARCGGCHGAELGGGDESPALKGAKFTGAWEKRAVSELVERVRTTMPADAPGSMGPYVNADVVAYVLAANGAKAGTKELASGEAPALYQRVEGKPIDRQTTEMQGNKPAFPEQTRAPYHASVPYKVTTLVDKMPVPWGMAFLPSGKILLTHRLPGSLRVLDQKGVLSEPVKGVAELASKDAQGIGVLEVALDPQYAKNHRIFLTFYDYIDGTNSNTCVASGTFDEAAVALRDAKVIFRGLPRIPSKRLGGKTGGRIAFGKDGTLFVSTGDRSDSPPWDVAQKLDNHLGKILHITADGSPAKDNPFLGKAGALPEIWAYGIRNAEGLAFDPKTGVLWENEHGPRGGDELNTIERGKNYGWPRIVHGIDYPGSPIGEGIAHVEGMEEPVYYWDPVIAPSGLAVYRGKMFPEWDGSIFVGGLRAKMVTRLTMKNGKVVAEEPLVTELNQRIRDVKVGPDGAVYVLTDSGTASASPVTPLESKLVKLTRK